MQRGFGFGDAWEKKPTGYSRRLPSHLLGFVRDIVSLTERLVIRNDAHLATPDLCYTLAYHGAISTLKKLVVHEDPRMMMATYHGLIYPQMRKWIGTSIPFSHSVTCPDIVLAECIGTDNLELVRPALSFTLFFGDTRKLLLALGSERIVRQVMETECMDRADPYSGDYIGAVRDLSMITLPERFSIYEALRTAFYFGNLDTLKTIGSGNINVLGDRMYSYMLCSTYEYLDIDTRIGMIKWLRGEGVHPDPTDFNMFNLASSFNDVKLLDCMYECGFPISWSEIWKWRGSDYDGFEVSDAWLREMKQREDRIRDAEDATI